MNTDRATEVLGTWDDVARSAKAPHQPARMRRRVQFPADLLAIGSFLLALALVLPLLRATAPGSDGPPSISPSVGMTDSAVTARPSSAPIVTCSGVSAEGCSAAVALVQRAYPGEFARTARVVVADSCPPPTICDRVFPFDAYAVLIAPDGGYLRALRVVGDTGPERILEESAGPLPPHVVALIDAPVTALLGRRIEIGRGNIGPLPVEMWAIFNITSADASRTVLAHERETGWPDDIAWSDGGCVLVARFETYPMSRAPNPPPPYPVYLVRLASGAASAWVMVDARTGELGAFIGDHPELLSDCVPTGLTRDQAVETAVRNAPPSDIPIRVESALEGRLDQFYIGAPSEEAGRHVWAVALVGSFRPLVEGEVAGVYRHHVVILDFTTGQFISGSGSP